MMIAVFPSSRIARSLNRSLSESLAEPCTGRHRADSMARFRSLGIPVRYGADTGGRVAGGGKNGIPGTSECPA